MSSLRSPGNNDRAGTRAYLAFAPEHEQKLLLDMLRERSDTDAAHAQDARFIRTLLFETRQRGYALNRGEWDVEPKFASIIEQAFVAHQQRSA